MTSPREWDAETYQRVSEPQLAWGLSVLARLELSGNETVVDAGCGTGRLTAELMERLPAGRVIALDLSHNMLTVARRELAPRFGRRVSFVQAHLLDRCLGPVADVVFSTATFHWVLDHPRLFRELRDTLVPGGRLMAQCGAAGNLKRTHERATALLKVAPFVRYASAWKNPWEFASAAITQTRLRDAGFVDVDTYVEAAPTRLNDADDFAEFATAVVLRPYLALFPDPAIKREFIGAITRQFASDPEPFVFDYCRLNISARNPD